jgi:hypothetical protein
MADEAAGGDADARARLLRQARADLANDAPDGMARHPFHWPLEFPEVFLRGNCGFDAFVGNPPFMGGRLVGRRLGMSYQEYLKYIRNDVVGGPDLCAYFFLRAFSVLGSRGYLGFLATKSIAETGSRVVCLDQIMGMGGTINRAIARFPWPGNAAVVVSIIWITREVWKATKDLDGRLVGKIDGALEEDFDIKRPIRLKELKGLFSQGQNLHGKFDLDREDVDALLKGSDCIKEVIYPLFNGQDLNNLPTLTPSRWAINFRNMPKQEARKYGSAFSRVEQLVKPFRNSIAGQIHQNSFWKYWDIRPKLLEEFSTHSEVLATAMVTKFVSFRRVPTSNVYTHKTIILFMYGWDEFAVLQSSLHQEWAAWSCGTLGTSTVSYSTSSALETWPMPKFIPSQSLGGIGENYHNLREEFLKNNSIGLTQFYNFFHNPEYTDPWIITFRELHRKMDVAVLETYGWTDLNPDHGFHEVPYLPMNDRRRFTLSEDARLAILRP